MSTSTTQADMSAGRMMHGPDTGHVSRMLASNYVALLVRMAIMIVLTREMFLLLPREAYGFWALLWSVFGYSVLLDLGFGTSVQKLTSEVMVHQRWHDYNRQLSSIITGYAGIAVLIVVLAFFPKGLAGLWDWAVARRR